MADPSSQTAEDNLLQQNLTLLECFILLEVALGATRGEIGKKLRFSIDAVSDQRTIIRQKLGAISMPHAISLAIEGGWVPIFPPAREIQPLRASEIEVMQLAMRGLSVGAIAATLGKARETVSHQHEAIKEKLAASTLENAIYIAYQNGLIPPYRPLLRSQFICRIVE